MIDIVVLAGGRSFLPEKASYKSLLLINSKPMVWYPLQELKSVNNIGKVVLVASKEVAEVVGNDYHFWVDSNASLTDNLFKGFEKTSSDYILICSADIPLVKANHIQWFIDEGLKSSARVVMPYITKNVIDKSYPGARRTYVRLKEGLVTLGNIALVERNLLGEIKQLIKKATDYRKNPLKIARLVGYDIVALYLLGLLSVKYIERRAYHFVKGPVRGLLCPYPEIGMDVDKIEDLEVVKRFI
ncbi:MAG: 2-phospho-L-lactate guanylyltransferase [candidate division WS2 bacterium]|uniref:2-phospho-L-lactate guanylyltransferase n=1 Tax=Psychracetigena formicireducens TaxID=2986056 RepID=A0A9E2BHI7_PSYF1|nr:2-phospho-L-lactate guanylyltransferase [Candidatus Psychracetigena formicireducens]MBT9144250.1 2-phospho-L-lactate guanylyltransferase [Candidatus Psychracetigena formicireducens]MBT9149912.1 2-phospho-L-lactate guanylyltransferase [Candidatus Psychracetigena formicireducens]